MTLNRILGLICFAAAVLFAFAGCKKEEIDAANAAAAAAAASPNPFVMGIGTLVSALLGSHFISKANDGVTDRKDYTDDDIRAMAAGLEKIGYVLTRKA